MTAFQSSYQTVTPEEVERILGLIFPFTPTEEFEVIQRGLRTLGWVITEIKNCKTTIQTLRNLLFGKKTENIPPEPASPKEENNSNDVHSEEDITSSSKESMESSPPKEDCIDNCNNQSASSDHSNETEEKKGREKKEPNSKSKKKNHGRNGLGAFDISEIIHIPHTALCPGISCPECKIGKLYTFRPQIILRIEGHAPMQARAWAAEGLRCNACQKIFRATFPKEILTQPKADFAAKSIVCLLKYQGGVPLYRIETIQKTFGIPVSDSEMWEWTEEVALILAPVHRVLMKMAANAPVIHHDDTTVKILDLIKENKDIKKKEGSSKDIKDRVGMFTTAILAKLSNHQIALYISGRKNAGENLDDLLDLRQEGSQKPIQAADASASNKLERHESEMSKCLVHARRKFYELLQAWPQECLHNLQVINQVFMNDRETKSMNSQDREQYHKEHSKDLLENLKAYNQKLLDEKKVEPNSNLGKAINYFNNHWEGLTLFLRNGEAPLSNNDCERAIKRKVLIRKNSYFYKNLYGALIGDTLLSVIQTCCANKINPYDYLNAVQANAAKVKRNPEEWVPWEYEKQTQPQSLLKESVLEKEKQETSPIFKEEHGLDKKGEALLPKGKDFIQKCANFFKSWHCKPKQARA